MTAHAVTAHVMTAHGMAGGVFIIDTCYSVLTYGLQL